MINRGWAAPFVMGTFNSPVESSGMASDLDAERSHQSRLMDDPYGDSPPVWISDSPGAPRLCTATTREQVRIRVIATFGTTSEQGSRDRARCKDRRPRFAMPNLEGAAR